MKEVTLTEFRGKTKEWLDVCDGGGEILLKRGRRRYYLSADSTNRMLVGLPATKAADSKEVLPQKLFTANEAADAVVQVTEGPIVNVEKFLKKAMIAKERRMSEYGCGCKKEDGSVMCGKHGRL